VQHNGGLFECVESNVSGMTIVLLPGFMLDDALWDDFIPYLPDDWRVQRVALPRGRNVRDVADGVAAQLVAPCVVLGFSMGGYVARSLASAYPELVEALVLVATSARDERPASSSPRAATLATFAGLSRRAIQSSLSRDHAEDAVLVERVHAMSVRLGADAFAWQSALDRTGVPLQAIACPTLVVAASEDRLRSTDESRELADAIHGARLRILEGTGHLVPLEAPGLLADAILDWLPSRRAGDEDAC
jgi:pimeloyl-ACP methyl ester carboxylesterase